MPRAKISTKSTVVDMTAMCDMAFINTSKGLHLTDAEMKNFYANPTAYIGVPFAYLKPLLDKDAEQLKAVNMQGIRIYGMFVYRCLDNRNYTTINAIVMPRAKISRKSTVVDMTAMCDVAFINTSKGLHLTDAEMKNFYANPTAYIGVPFAYLKPLLDKDAEQLKAVNMQGIPCKDSTDNELVDWMGAAVSAFQGGHMNLMVKGDQASKYPAFQGVIIALKKNEQFKFQLVTDPVQPPPGTQLARERGI